MNEPQLADYDYVVINSSSGKDSQTTLRYVALKAEREGYPKSRMLVAHADLGDMEWDGVLELARLQAMTYYGINFRAIARPQGDIIQHVLQRRMWPSPDNRWCTSDHKRGQIAKLFTEVVRSLGGSGKLFRILNVMGMRADESRARAKLKPFFLNGRATNGKRHVDNWLAIHSWQLPDVWADIKASGVPYHYAYDLGMPRLSCKFCIYAPKEALMIAGRRHPATLAQYVETERAVGHTFRKDFPIAKVQEAIAAGEDWGPATDWVM
jgi:3'-phosphoadenosine 5'-phosphosulfate sulfotransferase (PAPS reductase)/FAD synthetase